MPRQSKQFPLVAARRLCLAIIDRAIADVLENGDEAEAAGRWMSSGHFDSFVELFGCDPVVFRQRLPGRWQEFRSGDPWQDARL